MWGTIANLKENLNKIALDVHFDDEDDDGVGIPPYGSPAHGESTPVSDRRNSYGHTRARSIPRSPASNGTSTTDPPYASEVCYASLKFDISLWIFQLVVDELCRFRIWIGSGKGRVRNRWVWFMMNVSDACLGHCVELMIRNYNLEWNINEYLLTQLALEMLVSLAKIIAFLVYAEVEKGNFVDFVSPG